MAVNSGGPGRIGRREPLGQGVADVSQAGRVEPEVGVGDRPAATVLPSSTPVRSSRAAGGDVEGLVAGLVGRRLVDRRLEAAEVDDEVGVGHGGHVRGAQLQVVGLGPRLGEVGDLDGRAADPLRRVLERVEAGHHVQRRLATGRPGRVGGADGGGIAVGVDIAVGVGVGGVVSRAAAGRQRQAGQDDAGHGDPGRGEPAGPPRRGDRSRFLERRPPGYQPCAIHVDRPPHRAGRAGVRHTTSAPGRTGGAPLRTTPTLMRVIPNRNRVGRPLRWWRSRRRRHRGRCRGCPAEPGVDGDAGEGGVERPLQLTVEGDIANHPTLAADQVMMVTGQVFCQFVVGMVDAVDQAPHHAGLLHHRQVAVGRALGEVGSLLQQSRAASGVCRPPPGCRRWSGGPACRPGRSAGAGPSPADGVAPRLP